MEAATGTPATGTAAAASAATGTAAAVGGPRHEVRTEVLANLFQAVVDEMAWIVVRSAHTTFIKETQDFAACLVTLAGETFAFPYAFCATSQIGMPMSKVLEGVEWRPGDILATNDPYTTGGFVMHLNDFYLIRPIFAAGELLCFAWGFLHLTDVGGYAPGSIEMTNEEIFQEGLRLRPTKLFRDDCLNEEIWHVIADNSRIPDPNFGDVMALVSALQRSESRMRGLVERYGLEEVRRGMAAVLDATESGARAVLSRLPVGSHGFVDYFEDDYVSDVPVRLEVTVTVTADGSVVLDFTGSDPQVQAALNLPTGGQRHHPFLSLAITNLVVTASPAIHVNGGILRCIELVLPDSSVVNCTFPAAVGMRWSTAMRLHDLVLGALHEARPGSVPAAGAGQVVVTYVSTIAAGRRGRVVVANPVVGGSGGGPELDGETGIDFPVAFLRNVPVEVLEAEVPVIVERFAAVADSEGAGRYRGGFGVEYALRLEDPRAVVVMRGKDRHRLAPWGVGGGASGSNGSCFVVDGSGERRDLGKVTVYRAAFGDTVHIRGSGGGGFGDPFERDVDAVAADVADGLVSPERALGAYGVVLRHGTARAGGAVEVDEDATLEQRKRLAAGGREGGAALPGAVEPGEARRAFDRDFARLSARLATWLPSLPVPVRHPAKAAAYGLMRAHLARGERDDVDFEALLAEVLDRLDGSVAPPSATAGR